MSDAVIRIGVVGWKGRAGVILKDGFDATGGLIVPAACVEPFDDMYELGCKIYGFTPNRYKNISDMLEKEKLDAVIIGSPNSFHLEHLQCLAGMDIPVLLEKPLDSTFDKICEVVRFTRTYKGPILVGHCMRYAPILVQAKKMLKRGDIGRITSVRFIQNCHYGNAGYHNWRRCKETSGTWLIEKATHDFDIMLWMLEDRPKRIAAMQSLSAFGGDRDENLRCRNCPDRVDCHESISNTNLRWGLGSVEEFENVDDLCVFSSKVDTPDNDHCLFDFENGVIGTYVQWFFSPRGYHHRVYEIYGTEGAMEIDLGAEYGGKIVLCSRYGATNDRAEYDFDYLGRNHYNADGYMMQHFYHVVKDGLPVETTIEQAYLSELLGYAAIKSSEQGNYICPQQLLPRDLQDCYTKKVY